ncbi:phage integrase N-terminal SAM-like domain-containing protein [Sphingobium sp.]|uniref:phage integrase N-terminal SAM-like domain-containing protein n=1 Tax=Sphingobium sp. TaxID=1912891 RepID=UPI0039C9B436
MSSYISQVPATSLRQRMIDDMNMRRYARETQRNYVRDVARFATYLGRPPDTATAEDLRQFQIDQRASGMGVRKRPALGVLRGPSLFAREGR